MVTVLENQLAVRRPAVHNADLTTTVHAIKERVLTVKLGAGGFGLPPRPGDVHFQTTVARTLDTFKSLLPKQIFPISVDEFTDLYTGSKRRRYEVAATQFKRIGVRRKDAYITGFVKDEKLDLSLKENPVPRLIQPRKPVYNVALGRFLNRKVEKKIYHSLMCLMHNQQIDLGADHTMLPVVFKGLNAEVRGRTIASVWGRYTNPVAVGFDASRFDQHVSQAALRMEHSVYNHLYKNPELAKLLSWQLTTLGFCVSKDGWVKYKQVGGRCSGDMNTSLGNVLIMCLLWHAYIAEHGLRCSLVDDGDDCVLIMEQRDLPGLNQVEDWFLAMGFTMVREQPVHTLERVVFCQAQPVFDGANYIMCRDPRRCLFKDNLMLGKGDVAQQLDAVGMCGLSLTGGLPVMQAYYASMTTRRDSYANPLKSGMDYLALGMTRRFSDIADSARVSFWRAFNICPATQGLLEEYYTSVVTTPANVTSLIDNSPKSINALLHA